MSKASAGLAQGGFAGVMAVIMVGENPSATEGVILFRPGRDWAESSEPASRTANSATCFCIWFMSFSSETGLRLEQSTVPNSQLQPGDYRGRISRLLLSLTRPSGQLAAFCASIRNQGPCAEGKLSSFSPPKASVAT